MTTKNKKNNTATQVVTSKEIRLNSDLVGFIAEVIQAKIASEGNAEKIRELYEQHVGLRFTNVERVIKRSNRSGLVEAKEQLLKELGLTLEAAREVESLVKDLAKEKGERNYISVRV